MVNTILLQFDSNYSPFHPWTFPVLPPKYLRIFPFFSMISDWIQNGIELRIYYCDIKTERGIFFNLDLSWLFWQSYITRKLVMQDYQKSFDRSRYEKFPENVLFSLDIPINSKKWPTNGYKNYWRLRCFPKTWRVL